MCRIVAKKIVSQLIISLSWSPFFVRDFEQNFIPNLLQNIEHGATCTKLCVYKMADLVLRERTR